MQQKHGWLRPVDHRTIVPESPDSTVTSVEVNSDGIQLQSLPFAGEQCGISFTFGDVHLAVQTDPTGQNLRIVALDGTNFGKHFQYEAGRFESISASPGLVFHNLCIHKGAVTHCIEPASGHTEIKIQYL
jgi:hypothetical protein